MHRCICNDNEGRRDHSQARDIVPIGQGIKPKGTKNRCTRHLNVKAVLVINQGKEGDLIDNEGLEPVVENRELETY